MSCRRQKPFQAIVAEDERRVVPQGMRMNAGRRPHLGVDEELDRALRVVDQAEHRDRARLDTEVPLQSFRRREAQAIRYELLHPKVQRHGDVAVLTYNLQNYAKQADGTERPATRWNSSAVFRRIDGKWRTIHSHWSFTKPDLRSPGSP